MNNFSRFRRKSVTKVQPHPRPLLLLPAQEAQFLVTYTPPKHFPKFKPKKFISMKKKRKRKKKMRTKKKKKKRAK